MRAEGNTATEYLQGLPPAQQETLQPVYDVVHAAMPPGYAEVVGSGFITWCVPLERYPNTYNRQPLSYAALAAQKRHCSLYLMALYSQSEADAQFRARWQASGRKLAMGKSCLRFQRLADLDLDLIAETVAATPVEAFLATYERIRDR